MFMLIWHLWNVQAGNVLLGESVVMCDFVLGEALVLSLVSCDREHYCFGPWTKTLGTDVFCPSIVLLKSQRTAVSNQIVQFLLVLSVIRILKPGKCSWIGSNSESWREPTLCSAESFVRVITDEWYGSFQLKITLWMNCVELIVPNVILFWTCVVIWSEIK